jgi:hypothetical protein
LQQLADAGRNNALAKGGDHASRHKNIACHSEGKFCCELNGKNRKKGIILICGFF